jgi:hypothetical protein
MFHNDIHSVPLDDGFEDGTLGEVVDFDISATRPSRSFFLAANLALKLLCFDFNACISFHASVILSFYSQYHLILPKKD